MTEWGVFAAFGALIFLFVIIGIALYILSALGLYTMAKRRNMEYAWLAWIPVAQVYILGEIIGPKKFGDFEVPQPGLYLLGGLLALWVLSRLPAIGFIFSLAITVVSIGALYYLFRSYTTENTPVIYTILSVVTFGFLAPIFVFMVRNNEYNADEDSLAV
ncbi:MAG: hypothetical protein GX808_06810 [Syntrophomonadaceae bacterium]|jgi:hypothetical protein|nr:hypothetical protein [Syntrophomonadaceae bacterium]